MTYSFVEEEAPQEGRLQSFGKNALRQVSRTASNLGTRAIGLPGDVLSLVNEFAAKPISKAISGKEGIPYEETFLGKAIPTTEQHRRGLESATGDYLKPHNKVEQFADDIIEDAALLFTPGGKISKSQSLLRKGTKNLAKSIGANVVGQGVSQLSGSEVGGDVAKAGTLFLASLLDAPATAKQIGKLYQQAEKNLPSSATSNAKKLETNLKDLERKMTRGRPISNLAPSEKYVIDAIDKTKKLVKNGKISVEQAIAQKRSFNEDLAKLYEAVPAKKDQQRARKFAKEINSWLSDSIKEYGKNNPNFYEPFKDAENAFGVIAQSNFMSNWVQKNVRHSPLTSGLLHLMGGSLGAGAATVVAPYQAYKLSYRIAKSPSLRKIYAEALKSAAREDSVAFNKYLSHLDREIQKEESKDEWHFVE